MNTLLENMILMVFGLLCIVSSDCIYNPQMEATKIALIVIGAY